MQPRSWIFICAVLVWPSLASAEEPWETVGPFGGWINDLQEDGSGRLLAAASFGGIYRSADDAESWQQIYNGAVIFDPRSVETNSSGHIFVGSEGIDGVGFLRSTDDGDTWLVVNNTLSNKMVNDLLVTPNQNIFACTFDDGLFRSTNSGTTFTSVSGLPASFTTRIEANSDGHLFVGVQFETGNLYRSTDIGVTWERADTGISSDVLDIHASGSALYATNATGVYRSTNNGTNWTSLGAPSGNYTSVTVASNGDIYASLYGGILIGGKVYRSTNGGSTWTEDTGLPGNAVDRLLNTSEGRLFVAGKGPGVYRRSSSASTGGTDWEQKVNGMINTWIRSIAQDDVDGHLYAVSSNTQLFRSPDAGLSWERSSNGIPVYESLNRVAVNTDGTVFTSGAYQGVYRSTDQGDSWTSVHFAGATALACNSQGHVFAGLGGTMYRSTNNGSVWTSASLPTVQWIADIAFDGNTVYAATGTPAGFGSKGVYRSTDNGVTWAAFNDGLTDLNVTSIAVGDPAGASAGGTCTITAGTYESGIFDLDDLGTWVENPTFGPGRVVLIHKRSYHGTRRELIAEERGLRELAQAALCQWGEVPIPLLTELTALQMYLRGAMDGTAGQDPEWANLVGTVGYGILRQTADSPSDVVLEEPRTGSSLGQSDPNPFDRSTVIEFQIANREFVELKIFDVSGREVETLVNGQMDPGRYEVTWDGTGRSSGVFYSRLSTKSSVQTRSLVLLR